MKKIVLISSYCDTQEKINILSENIKVLKIFKNGNDPEMKEYLKELRG